MKVGVKVGVKVAVGVSVKVGVGVSVLGTGVGALLNLKLALALLPSERQVAETLTLTLSPGLPVTEKLPLRLPSRPIEADPETPLPDTTTLEAGVHQPLPLSDPRTVGAFPVVGLRLKVADWAAA